MLKADFVTISTSPQIIRRCGQIAKAFGYENAVFNNLDVMTEQHDEINVRFVVLSTEAAQTKEAAAGMVQVTRQIITEAFILVIVSNKLDPQSAQFIKKSGANAVLVENEVLNTSKLDYISTQKIKPPYIPIKVNEIKQNTKVDFPIFHLMPKNQKYLTIVHAGLEISDSKIKKMMEVGEVYIHRNDIDRFKVYIENHQDKSAAGLVSRCRAQYLSLNASYVDLAMLLTDQSEAASFDKGKELLDKVRVLSSELITSLGAIGEAWDVIDNSSIGDFGSVERSPGVASYAGIFSLLTDIGKPEEVMVATLIADIGILDLEPSITEKIRLGKKNTFDPEELAKYQSHPLISLNLVLSRKLPLTTELKNVILGTHERADQKGFPQQPAKVSEEAFLIQFSEMLDQASLIKMGDVRKPIKEIRQKVFDLAFKDSGRFSPSFLVKIKPHI